MKDYERLTKVGNGVFKYGEFYGKYTVDKGDIVQLCTEYDCAYGGKAIDRLFDLEDKIERGEIDYVADKDKEIARLTAEVAELKARLEKAVILPCKCEDTLYCVHWSKYNPKGGIITEEFVHKITLNDRNNTYTIHTVCNGIWTESKFVAIDFGDILFTDRAKAEARLAELKGGEGE